MKIRQWLLILRTLKHFNDVLNELACSVTHLTHIDIDYKDIDKKLKREIAYREKLL